MNEDWGLLLAGARADGVLSGHVPCPRVPVRWVQDDEERRTVFTPPSEAPPIQNVEYHALPR